jgi:hypothetical protein
MSMWSPGRTEAVSSAVDGKVTHGSCGLGAVTAVGEGIALLIDLGSHVQHIMTPSAKLTKL